MAEKNPKKSGQIAFLRGYKLEDNPCRPTTEPAYTLWIQGWHKQSKIECKGIELKPGAWTGCTQTDGDCPVCGK